MQIQKYLSPALGSYCSWPILTVYYLMITL
nr:MAG TPA: hypothetical protein [Caudoviricetes sp.]